MRFACAIVAFALTGCAADWPLCPDRVPMVPCHTMSVTGMCPRPSDPCYRPIPQAQWDIWAEEAAKRLERR